LPINDDKNSDSFITSIEGQTQNKNDLSFEDYTRLGYQKEKEESKEYQENFKASKEGFSQYF